MFRERSHVHVLLVISVLYLPETFRQTQNVLRMWLFEPKPVTAVLTFTVIQEKLRD